MASIRSTKNTGANHPRKRRRPAVQETPGDSPSEDDVPSAFDLPDTSTQLLANTDLINAFHLSSFDVPIEQETLW